MKVSVVIPAYNEEKYIGPCLESLATQTVLPDEVIVVDNNSTDRTSDIAKTFKNVTVIKESVQGSVGARDRGFNVARHPILARCDADSVLPPNWISVMKEDFEKHPEISAILGTGWFYDFPIHDLKPLFESINETFKKRTGHYPLFGSSMAITKSMWNKIKNHVCLDWTTLHEDVDLSIHVHHEGGIILYDGRLVSKISARRLKRSPLKTVQTLIDYSQRMTRTIDHHNHPFTFSDRQTSG